MCQVLWIWHGYMIDTCVLLSPRKNCLPIFLPRSWDICALSCTCLPELYILAPQYVARPFNEIQQNVAVVDILCFLSCLPVSVFSTEELLLVCLSTHFLKANLSYFSLNLYEKMTRIKSKNIFKTWLALHRKKCRKSQSGRTE